MQFDSTIHRSEFGFPFRGFARPERLRNSALDVVPAVDLRLERPLAVQETRRRTDAGLFQLRLAGMKAPRDHVGDAFRKLDLVHDTAKQLRKLLFADVRVPTTAVEGRAPVV